MDVCAQREREKERKKRENRGKWGSRQRDFIETVFRLQIISFESYAMPLFDPHPCFQLPDISFYLPNKHAKAMHI